MLQITPAERLALQSLAEGRTISQVAALLELRERDVDDLLIALFEECVFERHWRPSPPQ